MIPQVGPLLVHSDMGKGIIELRRANIVARPYSLLQDVLEFLSSATRLGHEGIVLPAFNYEFSNTGRFDPQLDQISVGRLPQLAQAQGKYVRTSTPFYSVLHSGWVLEDEGPVIKPFGATSFFGQLLEKDGSILMLGVGLNRFTFIHFVEQVCGPPLYRFDKEFIGTRLIGGTPQTVTVKMHVRPKALSIDYDWPKIEHRLQAAGAMTRPFGTSEILVLRAAQVLEVIGKETKTDPLWLLDSASRNFYLNSAKGDSKRWTREDFESE